MFGGVGVTFKFAWAVLAAIVATPSAAEPTVSPISSVQPDPGVDPQTNGALPAGTEIVLTMNDDLTTLDGQIKVGHQFRLTVAKDVRMGDYIIIPHGTPAVGEVTMVTGKGVFGKSGKMAVALRYLDLNGRRIPLLGTYRQEGRDNTVASVTGLAAAGVLGGVVTGRSAIIPAGRNIVAYTEQSLPVAFPKQSAEPAAAPTAAAN